MRLLSFIVFLSLLPLHPLRAGGTVDWDFHALPILRRHPELLKIIEDSLDIDRIGIGVRIGHDASGKVTDPGHEIGERIPPFEFPARLKGSGGAYNLILIIHDADTGLSQEGEKGAWIEIKPKT